VKTRELITAVELGASIVDIELSTSNLVEAIPLIKKKAECLVSLHELEKTSPLEQLKEIVKKQLAAGADICKVVTTAQSPADNLTTLNLIAGFPGAKIVSFAMGPLGFASRVLCPLVGGYFTYASLGEGKESAPGQLTVEQLKRIYGMMKK
jgi:3-dehydroquinate dehydratase type I